MKTWKKMLTVLVAVLLAVSPLFGCSSEKDPPPAPEPTLSISEGTRVLFVGESFVLAATLTNSDEKLRYIASEPDVADVTENGSITAYAPGISNITVTAGELSKTCVVTVTNSTVPLLSAGLTSSKVYVGDRFTRQIQNAVVTLDGKAVSPQPEITYASADNAIAKVSDTGVITGVSVGNTVITVSAVYNGTSLNREFAVTVEELTQFTINQKITLSAEASVYEDDFPNIAKISATGFENGDEITDSTDIAWASDNDGVVAVDEDGVITAVSEGSANVTATIGSVAETCKVTVQPQERRMTFVDMDSALANGNINVAAADADWASFVPTATAYTDKEVGGKKATAGKFVTKRMTLKYDDNGAPLNAGANGNAELLIKSDYTLDQLEALYEKGYTTIHIPVYLDFFDTTQNAKVDFITMKDIYSPNGLEKWNEVRPDLNGFSYCNIYNKQWTDVEYSLKWFIELQKGNLVNPTANNAVFSAGNTRLVFDTFVNNITACVSYDLYVDEIYLTRPGELINSFGYMNGGVWEDVNSYGAHEGETLDDYGKIKDQGTTKVIFDKQNSHIGFENKGGTGDLNFKYTVPVGLRDEYTAHLKTLKAAGYDSVKFPLYLKAEKDMAFGDNLAPNVADSVAASSTAKKSLVEAWGTFENGKYALDKLAKNAWTDVYMPIDWIITRFENGTKELFNFYVTATGDFKLYVGAVEGAKYQNFTKLLLLSDSMSLSTVDSIYGTQLKTGTPVFIAFHNGEAIEADEISWESSDPAIASVENGTVTAVALGTATLTASVGNVQKTMKINVVEPEYAARKEYNYLDTGAKREKFIVYNRRDGKSTVTKSLSSEARGGVSPSNGNFVKVSVVNDKTAELGSLGAEILIKGVPSYEELQAMYNVGYTKLIVPVYMEYTDPEYLGDGKVGYKDLCDWNADGYNSDGGNATAHNGDMCKSIMLLHEGKWNKVEYSLRRILAEIEKIGQEHGKDNANWQSRGLVCDGMFFEIGFDDRYDQKVNFDLYFDGIYAVKAEETAFTFANDEGNVKDYGDGRWWKHWFVNDNGGTFGYTLGALGGVDPIDNGFVKFTHTGASEVTLNYKSIIDECDANAAQLDRYASLGYTHIRYAVYLEREANLTVSLFDVSKELVKGWNYIDVLIDTVKTNVNNRDMLTLTTAAGVGDYTLNFGAAQAVKVQNAN